MDQRFVRRFFLRLLSGGLLIVCGWLLKKCPELPPLPPKLHPSIQPTISPTGDGLFHFSGSKSKHSKVFIIPDSAKVEWVYKATNRATGDFVLSIITASGAGNLLRTECHSNEGTGIRMIPRGSYYLRIDGEGDWDVKVSY